MCRNVTNNVGRLGESSGRLLRSAHSHVDFTTHVQSEFLMLTHCHRCCPVLPESSAGFVSLIIVLDFFYRLSPPSI